MARKQEPIKLRRIAGRKFLIIGSSITLIEDVTAIFWSMTKGEVLVITRSHGVVFTQLRDKEAYHRWLDTNPPEYRQEPQKNGQPTQEPTRVPIP